MNQIVQFMRDNPTFYLATTDENGHARVRPFGAVSEFEEKVYICTSNLKKVHHQMLHNPRIEISITNPENKWIRISAEAVHDPREEAKKAMLDQNEFLHSIYSLDDGKFEVFYLKNVSASLFGMDGTQEEITG